MFRRFVFGALLPLAALATVSAAKANIPDDVSVDVSYAGLDLSTPAGAALFRTRINQAVNEICGWSDSRDLAGMRRMHECRSRLADKTEPRLVAQVEAARQQQSTATVDQPAH